MVGANSTMRPFHSSWSNRYATLVGDGVTIICDGGVRRGSDIVKAIALGADAVTVGTPLPLRARGCG